MRGNGVDWNMLPTTLWYDFNCNFLCCAISYLDYRLKTWAETVWFLPSASWKSDIEMAYEYKGPYKYSAPLYLAMGLYQLDDMLSRVHCKGQTETSNLEAS